MDDEKVSQFLAELTVLSDKYGIGINDIECTELYELEPEDASRRYSVDNKSFIHFE